MVGAGPTGLVLALSLTRAGVAVRLVDRRAGVGRESRALDVQARTLELYRQLGVAEAVVAAGVRVEQLVVREHGRAVVSLDVRRFGRGLSPYPFTLSCPQDDHEAVLVAALAAAGVAVEWRTELVTLQDLGDRVQVRLSGPDGAAEEATFGYLGGCDGMGSTVRRELGVPFPGSTSDQSYFVADVTATGPAITPAGWSGPGRTPRDGRGTFSFCLSRDDFMLVVPARRSGTHRLIGLVPAGTRHAEVPDGRGAVAFDAIAGVVERATDTTVQTCHWFSTYQVSHRVADRFRSGRAFLLGDAAHVHSPLGGQGMNTGIADAANLGWKLAAVVQGRAGPALLDSYEPERRPFAQALVATTDRLFGVIAGAGAGHRLARGVLFRVLLPGLLRLPPTRTAVCLQVAQLRVRYRSSALSRGAAGRVRGGDRLPFVPFGVELGEGHDNFEPLGSLDWQLHVYGVVRPELRACAVALGLAVHELPWSPRAGSVGLRRDAGYLVRPDGYVALADPGQRPEELGAYWAVVGPSAALAPAAAGGPAPSRAPGDRRRG